MPIEFDRDDKHEDPLEQTELARRLRRMEWPPAPPEVKERVLARIVGNQGREFGPRGSGEAASGPSGD